MEKNETNIRVPPNRKIATIDRGDEYKTNDNGNIDDSGECKRDIKIECNSGDGEGDGDGDDASIKSALAAADDGDSRESRSKLNNLHDAKEDELIDNFVVDDDESNSSIKAEIRAFSIDNKEITRHIGETDDECTTTILDGDDVSSRNNSNCKIIRRPTDTNHLHPHLDDDAYTLNADQKGRESISDRENIDSPYTELSNASVDDYNESDEKVGEATVSATRTHSSIVTELLDDLSDFNGFDDGSIRDTREKLALLAKKRDELTRQMENERLKAKSHNDSVIGIKNLIQQSAISTPNASYDSGTFSSGSRSSTNYVYQLAKDVNIFQEQVPSGSKRQKKKRKFFDDSDKNTQFIHKKLNVIPKQQSNHGLSLNDASNLSNLSTSVTENKENFRNDQHEDRIAFDSIVSQHSSSVSSCLESTMPTATAATATTTTTTTTTIPPTSPATTKKTSITTPRTGKKKKGFDISNPLFKEPFKHGWTREIVFRELPEGKKGKSAYVTYFDSGMKKYKTIRHIVETLPPDSGLGSHHFTFSKGRIFGNDDPSAFEIVRHMRYTPKVPKVPKDSNSSADSIKMIDEMTRLNSSFPLIRPAQQQEPKKKKVVTLERGPGGRWISANATPNTSTSNVTNQNAVSPNTCNQLEFKSKSSKKPKAKIGDEDDLWSEISSNTSSTAASSKPSMPKILIRGVGVSSPNTNSKMTNSKLKFVSTFKPSGFGQKKGSTTSKKILARADEEDCLSLEPKSDTLSDLSYYGNTSSLNSSSVITNRNSGERFLKRKYSGDDNSEEWNAQEAKIRRLESPPVATRSSLTLSNISCLFDPLVLCFKYLTVKELLRVSITCKYLNVLSSDSRLWSTVRLKNSKITNWDGFAAALRKHSTKRLDMRKMLCPTGAEDLANMWKEFERVISQVDTLQHVDFMRCSPSILRTVANGCPNLRIINALQLNKSSDLSVECFSRCKCLRELRLKGFPFVNLEPNNNAHFRFLNADSLRVLSITNAREIEQNTLDAIRELQNLRVLELGDCESLPQSFTDVLVNMKKLERLRLEKVVNLDPEYRIFDTLQSLPHFETLELINFEVKIGFDKALSQCQNLRELLLIPLYRTQSATANRLIMDGVKTISNTLRKFAWALTNELLKVTDLFLQEYHPNKSQDGSNAVKNEASVANNGSKMPLVNSKDALQQTNYCIPIIRKMDDNNPDSSVEIEVIAFSKLESQVVAMLPNTKVRILKIPFNSANRYSISECFK